MNKLLKINYRIKSIIKLTFFKIYYLGKITIKRKVRCRKYFTILIDSTENNTGKIEIGENVFFNNGCSIVSMGKISIGNNCLFGENVKIYDHNHKFSRVSSIYQQGYSVGEIHIGNNCWICNNVCILKGAFIGDNCVIGANCTINIPVPSNSIVEIKNSYLKITPIDRKEQVL